jgi:hypothetical protein
VAKRKRERNGQESGIVVRGRRATVWWGIKTLIGEGVFELVEW